MIIIILCLIKGTFYRDGELMWKDKSILFYVLRRLLVRVCGIRDFQGSNRIGEEDKEVIKLRVDWIDLEWSFGRDCVDMHLVNGDMEVMLQL